MDNPERARINFRQMSRITKALFNEMTSVERARLFWINVLEANRVIRDRYRLNVVRDRLAYRVWKRVLARRPEWNRYTRGSFELDRLRDEAGV